MMLDEEVRSIGMVVDEWDRLSLRDQYRIFSIVRREGNMCRIFHITPAQVRKLPQILVRAWGKLYYGHLIFHAYMRFLGRLPRFVHMCIWAYAMLVFAVVAQWSGVWGMVNRLEAAVMSILP